LSALSAASRVSFAGDGLAQRRQPPSDRDLDAAAAIDEVREKAAAQRLDRDAIDHVLLDRPGGGHRRGTGRGAGRRVDGQEQHRQLQRQEAFQRHRGAVARPPAADHRPRVRRVDRALGGQRLKRRGRLRRDRVAVLTRQQHRAHGAGERGVAAQEELERAPRARVDRSDVERTAQALEDGCR